MKFLTFIAKCVIILSVLVWHVYHSIREMNKEEWFALFIASLALLFIGGVL